MKKLYIIGIIIIALVVGAYLYLNLGVRCYDGYGSGLYVTKSQLETFLESFGSGINNSINREEKMIAYETYSCGDTDYLVLDGDKFKDVSKSNFQKFIDGNSGLYKIIQTGNSPYFVKDLTTNAKYVVVEKDGKYVLSVERY